jgi:hypothetical protein
VLFIKLVSSSIPVAVNYVFFFFPVPIAVLEPFFKLTFILTAIFPQVGTLSEWFAGLVLSHVGISVREKISPFAMFKAADPLSIISVTFKHS